MLEHRPGVYLITCQMNGCRYVGSSKDVRQRIWDHQSALRRGKHANSRMQNSWNKYGETSFTIEALEYTEDETTLIITEQMWIDSLNPEFNSRLIADRNTGLHHTPEAIERMRIGLIGLKHTQETKDKIRAYRLKFVNTPEAIENMKLAKADMSEETRLRMSVAKLGVPPTKATEAAAKANTGKHRSQEVKDKISASKQGKPVKNQLNASKAGADATRGKPRSEETSRKIAETVARKKTLGLTKHSPETIAKIREARATKTPKHH